MKEAVFWRLHRRTRPSVTITKSANLPPTPLVEPVLQVARKSERSLRHNFPMLLLA
jgi:hypothetical protein